MPNIFFNGVRPVSIGIVLIEVGCATGAFLHPLKNGAESNAIAE